LAGLRLNMKRTVLITFSVCTIIAVLCYLWIASSSSSPGRVDAEKLVRAVDAYTRDLQTRGIPMGKSVSLENLIQSGFLDRDDVSGFDGMEVHIDVDADETKPQHTMVRVRMPDGHELAVFGDGSVQSVEK
jgi:hypothetical protein